MGWADFFGDSFESGLNSAPSVVSGSDAVPLTPAQGGGGMQAENAMQAGLSAQDGLSVSSSSNWWEKAIEKAMPSIMGAAMKPKGMEPRAPAAPGGHAIQPNTSGIMKPFDEIRSMADDNPLENIHQWSNLFG